MKSFKKASKSYLDWLGTKVILVPEEVEKRHKRIAEATPFEFLRATFYRWTQHWSELGVELNYQSVPLVLGVGDLHVENFGTWRDAEGRLVWGINDFDECCYLPYMNDLVRLATSTRFAIEEQATLELEEMKELSKKVRSEQMKKDYNKFQQQVKERVDNTFSRACQSILTGYCNGLEVQLGDTSINGSKRYSGRKPFVLAEEHDWLREIVLNKLREKDRRTDEDPEDDFDEFFRESNALEYANDSVPRSAWEALRLSMPDPGISFRIGKREAGLGSLGRQRFTAIVEDWHGGILVREAKALAPSAWLWWDEKRRDTIEILYDEALRQVVRARDPWVQIHLGSVKNSWIVRRLAPDSGKVKLKDLPQGEGIENQLWQAMGREVANVHIPLGNVRKDLEKRNEDQDWLRKVANNMADKLLKDWEQRATLLEDA